MEGYLHIEELFKSILAKSTIIDGRFHISYKYGMQEINSDQLGEILTDVKKDVKYPLVIMAPPTSTVDFSVNRNEWERYRLILFFCNTTYYQNKTITQQNLKTKTSQQSVQSIWQDMKILAIDFMRELINIQRSTPYSIFRVPANNQTLIKPFSITGQDRISGVSMHFNFDLSLGCEITEYGKY